MRHIYLVKSGIILAGLMAFSQAYAGCSLNWGSVPPDGGSANSGADFGTVSANLSYNWMCGADTRVEATGGCSLDYSNGGTTVKTSGGGCGSSTTSATVQMNSGTTTLCRVYMNANNDNTDCSGTRNIKVNQVVTLISPGAKNDVDPDYVVYATAKTADGVTSTINATNALSFTSLTTGICTVAAADLNNVTIHNTGTSGTCTVKVTAPGDANIKGPVSDTKSWTINNTRYPVLAIVQPVGAGQAPSFVFSSSHVSKANGITIGGSCAAGSTTGTAIIGNNTFRLGTVTPLTLATTYSDCTVSVTTVDNLTTTLAIPPFTVIANVAGPGGVGSNDGKGSLLLWLDGANFSSGTWLDASGNDHHFTAYNSPGTTTRNSRNVVTFNGTNQYFQRSYTSKLSSLSTFALFTANQPTSSALYKALYSDRTSGTKGPILYSVPTSNNWEFWTGDGASWNAMAGGSTAGSWTMQSLAYGGTGANMKRLYINGDTITTGTSNFSANTASPTRVGAGNNEGTADFFFNGQIGEVLLYNSDINLAQRIILTNYLAAKYSISAGGYATYSYGATHGYEMAGVGQASDSSTHLSGKSSMIQISGPTGLANNTFLMWGHDNGALSFQVGDINSSLIAARINRVWRIRNTGISTATVSVHIADLPGFTSMCFNPANIRLLLDSDGAFADTPSSQTRTGTYNANTHLVTFTGVTLTDGYYMTFGIGGNNSTVYVTTTGAGNKDGSTWANACTLTGALTSPRIPSDVVKVATGVYKPTGVITLNTAITIRGGYAGVSESESSNPVNFPTIISGDLGNDDEALGDLIMYHRDIHGSNLSRLFYAASVPGTITLENFTITGMSQGPGDVGVSGNGSHASVMWQQSSTVNYNNMKFYGNRARELGGAILVYNSSVATFNNCEFVGNAGELGGAINAHVGSTVNVNNSTFTGNYAILLNNRHSNNDAVGGAIDVNSGSQLAVTNSVFTGNQVVGTGGSGGAISLTMNSDSDQTANKARATISGSTFTSNASKIWGGAIYAAQGFTSLTVNNSDFTSNRSVGDGLGWAAHGGGAIAVFGTTTAGDGTVAINDSEFVTNDAAGVDGNSGLGGGVFSRGLDVDVYLDMTIKRSTFERNMAGGGAGVFVWGYGAGANNTHRVLNSTFAENTSLLYYGGAIAAVNGVDLDVSHSTFYKNTAVDNGGGIFAYGTATDASILNSLFLDNSATVSGNNFYDANSAVTDIDGATSYNILGYNGVSGWHAGATYGGSGGTNNKTPVGGSTIISTATSVDKIINLPMAYNGGNGLTKTFKLSSNGGTGSQAFNRIPIANCLTEDQRQEPRAIVGTFIRCDVGSYETGKVDTDSDGLVDALDNCPTASNANQSDLDGDSLGDLCDADIDGDGVLNGADYYPTKSICGATVGLAAGQCLTDTDHDGIADVCNATCQSASMVADSDLDGDSVPNASDNCPYISNLAQGNVDLDSLGDACDIDMDNDGFDNDDDNCPLIVNPLQTDSNGNGKGDECDVLYVKPTAQGLGDCSSWANACAGGSGTQLQAVINQAEAENASHIYLAKGIYRPSATVNLATAKYIYGGFKGDTELYYYDADPTTNLTIITGDKDSNDVVDANGIVQSYLNQSGTNLGNILLADTKGTSAESTIVLDGIVLTGATNSALRINSSRLRLTDMNMVGNKGSAGGAIYLLSEAKLYDVNGRYSGNQSADGGAIKVAGVTSTISLSGSSFSNNKSTGNGGALSIDSGWLTGVDTMFLDNQADLSGGAIYASAADKVSITGTTFSGNSALTTTINTGGGAMFVQGQYDSTYIGTSEFIENTSTRDGGAVMVYASADDGLGAKLFTVEDTLFESNKATGTSSTGGAIVLSGASGQTLLTLTRDSFVFNTSKTTGGAVQLLGATTNILSADNTTFFKNSSTTMGGAVFMSGGADATFTHVTFLQNAATTTGGAIRVDNTGSIPTLKNSLVVGNTAGTGGPNISIITGGSWTDSGYNLIGYNNASGLTVGATNNVVPASPSFVSAATTVDTIVEITLKDFGGLFDSIALKSASPARDKIPNGTNGCVTDQGYDERGYDRPDRIDPTDPDQSGDIRKCDIGAFEFNNSYRVDCYAEDGLRPADGSGVSINYCPDGTPTAPAEITQSVVGSVNGWMLLMLSMLGGWRLRRQMARGERV